MSIIAIAFGCLAAQARESWEICLDNADFSYNHDTFTEGTFTARKDGCRVSLVSSIGRGERFEIDLCDPLIHLTHYGSVDALASGERVIAPPGSCSAPGFGANFEENAREIQEFAHIRRKALNIFEKVKLAYAPKADLAKIGDSKAFTGDAANAKIACGQLLLKTYLIQCEAFEQKKEGGSGTAAPSQPPAPSPAPTRNAPPPPGIHPQTILPK